MRLLKIILIALAFISLQAHAADGRTLVVKESGSAGKRVALVIGNSDYQYPDSLPKLANPTHDAEDIAAALRGFGFEVIEKKNQTKEDMDAAIAEFGRKIGDSEAALFYFAGHGLQVKGQNYLIPVDARIETEAQVPYKSINVNQLLEEMDNGKSRANIVMLDACRNNPISGKFRSGTTRGLAVPTSQPKGTVIVYATDPGNVAADGDGRNGLFTAGLLAAFKGSDLSLGGVLVRASEEVERASEQKQTPYINGPATLQKNFQFGQGTQIASLKPVPAPVQPAARIKSRDEIEQESWERARDSANIGAIQEYLKQYPKGRFAGQARILIATLKTAPAKPAEPIATPGREDNETALWTEAQKGNTREDYQAYLGQYPKGKYAALAKGRLNKLEAEAAQQFRLEHEAAAQQATQAQAVAAQQEQSAWDSANGTASEASYQGYLNSYPQGRYATLATARIAKLKKEAAQAEAEMKPGKVFRDCPDCPELVVIPAGSFDMGETNAAHSVTIGKPFIIGKTEVTQGQWKAVMGNNPSGFPDCGDTCPVENISWNDAKEFIQKLNTKTVKQYRLPSEAEWEYACRAGGKNEYCGSDSADSVAWYGSMFGGTHPVAGKQANAFGLYDMSGNVWEWVEDSYHDSYNGAPSDGTAWQGDGAKRVLRGGAWHGSTDTLRSASRSSNSPASRRVVSRGFRVARTLP